MSAFAINFSLKPLGDIVPWGGEHKSLSWFGMTDSELWIRAGEQTIYEYSDAARRFWNCDIRYNDYQLSRFLEDFSWTFNNIRESIPREFYDIIGDLGSLFIAWRELHEDDSDDDYERFFDEEYQPLTEWFHDRVLDSMHLVGGPLIGCFRCGEMIKVWWHSDYTLDSGESIWTAPSGVYELPYSEFVGEVKRFFDEFYDRMDEQVRLAVEKDWGEVEVDKEYLVRENKERKNGFDQQLALLGEDCRKTDWSKPAALFEKMKKELSTGD